jgi:hypothetical protein
MSNYSHAVNSRDLEWAVWKQGDKVHSIPAKTKAERAGEESDPNGGPRAPRPEDYTFVGR